MQFDGATNTVDDYLSETLGPAAGKITGVSDIAADPSGSVIAFTAFISGELGTSGRTEVRLVSTQSGEHHSVDGQDMPTWSSDGNFLACRMDQSTVLLKHMSQEQEWRVPLGGVIEYMRFSPSGAQLLIGLAEHGSDLSGAEGSGALPSADLNPFAPYVEYNNEGRAWRRVWSIDVGTRVARCATPQGSNVWEADWCGEEIVAISSPTPDESAWYSATIVRFKNPSQTPLPLATSKAQIGLIRCSPDGMTIAYVEACCSDRGVIAGDLILLDSSTNTRTRINSKNVDITSLSWRDSNTLLVAGQSHLRTVIANVSVDGQWRELWTSDERTCGTWYPEVSPIDSSDDTFVASLHGYGLPPAITVVSPSSETVLVDTHHEGTDAVAAHGGQCENVTWPAPDGVEIEGVLVTPPGDGPHPLIILIHGGPVAAYRASWEMIYGWTPFLVSTGYAVLHPNPRGSGGRGQAFAALVQGDMGGADVDDFISAAEHLVSAGVADPARIGLAGRSYGGYMSAWLPTRDSRWAASIPMAPVTNWFSQHFTSNIPAFDEIFLGDRATNSSGKFASRSPVFYADLVDTPILSITGGNDRCTPPTQAIEFHRALLQHNRDSSLVVYPSEGHHIDSPTSVRDVLARILAFLDEHMPTDARAPQS